MSEGDLLSGGQEEIARMSQRAIRLEMELA